MVSRFNRPGFLFWQQWLFYTSLFFLLFGLSMAFFGDTVLFRPYTTMISDVFWNKPEPPQTVVPFLRFTYACMGATIACCYTLLAYIAWFPFRKKKRWARNAILVAFGLWAIIDTTACFYSGVYAQAYLMNSISIILKALPLLFTRKDF